VVQVLLSVCSVHVFLCVCVCAKYLGMNLTVLRLPTHHGDLIARMPSTILRPHVLVLYRLSGKLGRLAQSGRQDSVHVTVAVVPVNLGLDCMLTECTADDEIH